MANKFMEYVFMPLLTLVIALGERMINMKPENILKGLVYGAGACYIATMLIFWTVDWTITLFVGSYVAVVIACIWKINKQRKAKVQ